MERLEVSVAHQEAEKATTMLKEGASQYGESAGYVEWCLDRLLATVARFSPEIKRRHYELSHPDKCEALRNYARISQNGDEAKIFWVNCQIRKSSNVYTFSTFYTDHVVQERIVEDIDYSNVMEPNSMHPSEFLTIAHGVRVDQEKLDRFKEGLS